MKQKRISMALFPLFPEQVLKYQYLKLLSINSFHSDRSIINYNFYVRNNLLFLHSTIPFVPTVSTVFSRSLRVDKTSMMESTRSPKRDDAKMLSCTFIIRRLRYFTITRASITKRSPRRDESWNAKTLDERERGGKRQAVNERL